MGYIYIASTFGQAGTLWVSWHSKSLNYNAAAQSAKTGAQDGGRGEGRSGSPGGGGKGTAPEHRGMNSRHAQGSARQHV